MKQYTADKIRNVGLFSHGGAGKTSLAEAFLYDSETVNRLGKVEDGTTVTDFDPDEIKRHISVSTALAPLAWGDTKINVIDAPGYADFLGEVNSALRVSDGAIVLIDASAGIEVGTEQAWRLLDDREIPRLVFINKMDRENADFFRFLESARSAFGTAVSAIEIPIGSERDFVGTIDLLSETATYYTGDGHGFETKPIPDDLAEIAAEYRRQLVEAIAEQDEGLMLRYLEDDPIRTDELVTCLKECVRARTVVPVLCGAATLNRGVQPLLDAIVTYLPAASERREQAIANGQAVDVAPDPNGPLAAIAFKTLADPHVGRVSYLRAFSGTIRSNSQVMNVSRGEPERIGQLFFVRGKDHINTDVICAGDIGAVSKLAVTTTGDTLGSEANPIVLEPTRYPKTSYSASVHARTKSDLDKLGTALQRLADEDPALQLSRDPVSGETIVSGLGERHVQISIDRMSRRFNVNVELGLPRVAYRETISTKTIAEYKHKKQTGGAGQYGHVFLELEPLGDGEFEFGERVFGGSVPRNFFPAVEKGVREGLEAGPVAGFPVVNLRVTLTDGSYHAVDSNEMAFKIAAKEAFKKGILAARPVLLEPILTIEVTVPDNYTGDVMSDLNTKRAQVSGMAPSASGATTITATVPAAEVQRYATDLRSITQGRGSFTTEFAHYQTVPPHIAEHVVAAAKQQEHVAH